MRALINVKLSRDGNGKFPTPQEVRKILCDIGLEPTDMPATVGAGDPPENGSTNEKELHKYFLERAKHIIARIPGKDKDEKEDGDEDGNRKQRTIDNLVYASDLPKSSTDFMVTAHTTAFIRFRLLNPKLEDLQEGCEELVQLIMGYNNKGNFWSRVSKSKAKDRPRLTIAGRIRILEHGLEEPTISGEIIASRLRALWEFAAKDVVLLAIGLVGFVLLVWLSNSASLAKMWHDQADRFSTAMLTTAAISAISLFHNAIKWRPLIKWSLTYVRSA